MIIALWLVTLALLASWSLFAWGLHALLSVDPAWLDDVQKLVDQIPYAAVVEQWLPGWRELVAMSLDFSQVALGWLGGAAPWLVWLLWGAGTVALLLLAGLGTLAIQLIRRPAAPAGAAA